MQRFGLKFGACNAPCDRPSGLASRGAGASSRMPKRRPGRPQMSSPGPPAPRNRLARLCPSYYRPAATGPSRRESRPAAGATAAGAAERRDTRAAGRPAARGLSWGRGRRRRRQQRGGGRRGRRPGRWRRSGRRAGRGRWAWPARRSAGSAPAAGPRPPAAATAAAADCISGLSWLIRV